MNAIRPKVARVRLDRASYETLRQHVLSRDGWRCQSCGTMSDLEVHHQQFRSHSGDDSEPNLITLCRACHTGVHYEPQKTRKLPISPFSIAISCENSE
jgi:5-methylcytosine-specific restriction endonuclease McrA